MARTKTLTTMTFHVEGSNAGRLELDVLPDLVAYKRLVVETAKDLWRRAHPDASRLPNNFEANIRLQIEGAFRTSSTAVPVIREYVDSEGDAGVLFSMDDEVEEAADLIEATVVAAARGSTMPPRMPRRVIPMFERLGKCLGGRDSMILKSERRAEPAVFDANVREYLIQWTPPTYQDSVRVTGEVTRADVEGRSFGIKLPNDTPVEGLFSPERESDLTAALHKHASVHVAITGVGDYSTDDASLLRIVRIDTLTLLTVGEETYDSSAPPVWKSLVSLGASVPPEAWEKIPTDLAEDFDRHAHGTDDDRD